MYYVSTRYVCVMFVEHNKISPRRNAYNSPLTNISLKKTVTQ